MKSPASTSYSVPVGGKLAYTGAWTWPTSGPGYEQFHNLFEFARNSMLNIERMRNELTAAGKLTPEGIKDELTNAATEFYRKFGELRRTIIEAHTTRLSDERTKLIGVPARESFDYAGAVQDWEIARWFAGLDGDKRNAVLARTIAGAEPEVAAALLRVPAVITGVTPQTRQSLQMSAVPVANREKVAAIDDTLEAAGAAEYALRAAAKVVSDVSGFVPSQRAQSGASAPSEASVSNEG